MKRRRVLVVGGGISGLTLARALAGDGHEVTVVEQAEAWAPLGAGITLAGNAMAVLDRLGRGDAVRAAGRQIAVGDVTDASGRPLVQASLGEADDTPALSDFWALHRADLHEVLVEGASDAELVLGTRIESYDEEGDALRVVRTDGVSQTVDLMVGADGIRSQVRELAFGESAPRVRYAGYTCWRVVVPDRIELAQSFEMWGRGARIGLVPLAGNRVYSFLVANAPAGGKDPDGPERLGELVRRFAAFGDKGRELLASLEPSDAVLRHDIEELARPAWRRGRVVLVGDAAHAMTPNLGQGAAQGIEDAFALCLALRHEPDIPAAAAAYERARDKRARAIWSRSRTIGRVGQWSGPVACALRAALLRATPSRSTVRNIERLIAPGLDLAARA